MTIDDYIDYDVSLLRDDDPEVAVQIVPWVLIWSEAGTYSPTFAPVYGGWVWERDEDALAGVYLATVEMAKRVTLDIVEEM